MGNVILAASTAAKTSGSSYLLPVIIVVLFGLFYFVMIRPQRNRQRQVMQMQRGVGPGAKIRTTSGMYATVVSVEDDDVVLEVAPGVQVRFLRRAIMDVVDAGPLAAQETTADADAASDATETAPAEDGHRAE